MDGRHPPRQAAAGAQHAVDRFRDHAAIPRAHLRALAELVIQHLIRRGAALGDLFQHLHGEGEMMITAAPHSGLPARRPSGRGFPRCCRGLFGSSFGAHMDNPINENGPP